MIRAIILLFALTSCSFATSCSVNQSAHPQDCAAFAEAREQARHAKEQLPTADLERLLEINRSGGAICSEDLRGLTAEIDDMLERLP